jgi:hypothetical protein
MSRENPLWGAPRIHGELLMLGIDVSESTVGRYMIRGARPRSQRWKTFLRNQAAEIGSIDLFVVRTISFKLLYGLVILRHARRQRVRIAVTSNPTAEWIAGQVTEAFPLEAKRRVICAATATVRSGRRTLAVFGQWESGIIRSLRARLGRTGTSSGSLARFGARVSIIWWCAARRICVASSRLTLHITTRSGPTCH